MILELRALLTERGAPARDPAAHGVEPRRVHLIQPIADLPAS